MLWMFLPRVFIAVIAPALTADKAKMNVALTAVSLRIHLCEGNFFAVRLPRPDTTWLLDGFFGGKFRKFFLLMLREFTALPKKVNSSFWLRHIKKTFNEWVSWLFIRQT